ncbi:MAG: DNA ligase D, partial [Chloroflexi bacterium RBG_13_46_9]
LAVMVEDHPVDYATFEGIIPKGEYGAGQVIVWDSGDYSPEKEGNLFFDDRARAQEHIRQGLEKGKISFTLRGHKLKGSWTLVKMQKTKDNWLLMKHKDDFADTTNDVLEKGKSVVSGLTIDDLRAGRLPSRGVVDKISKIPGVQKQSFPTRITPMLASLALKPFSDPDWIFEPKLDGFRVIAAINKGKVTLISRNGIDITRHYPLIAESLKKQSASNLLLDGEVIALDRQGKQCFQCLQGFLDAMRHRKPIEKASSIIYYVFDILYLDGFSLFELPLIKRKDLLERAIVPSREVRLIEHFEGDGKVIFQSAVDQGLEGIVAKRKDSHYIIGKRSPDWLKIKSTLSDDFVIGGYTQGAGSRASTFGSLLLGYFDDKNRLMPVGNVGTGFDERRLAELKKQLDTLQVKKSPFASKPELTGIVTWVKPVLVVEVKFAEMTRDGRLRAPVFLRLRDDKPPEQVHVVQTKIIKDPAEPPHTQKALPKEETNSVLRQLKNTGNDFIIDIDGQKIELSNLNKELWPAVAGKKGLTKREFLVYLARVAPYFLKHLANRPITLKRYPDGINGIHFFQKHWNGTIPDFVETVTLSEQRKKGEYILCNNLPTLIWLGQLADIEFHTW